MVLKNIYFLVILLGSMNLVFSNNTPDNNTVQKLKKMGLVWGLLKYHHPDVSDGQYDWEDEFIQLFAQIEKLDGVEKVDSALLMFVKRFDTKDIRTDDAKNTGLFLKNSDYSWIDNSINNAELIELLHQLKQNKNISDYYTHVNSLGYMDFPNEGKMKDFNLMKASHRLLMLFEFWNVIQYWYANKYLITDNWEGILEKYIPSFLDCENNFEFELLKSKLFVELKDSHTVFYSKTIADSLFKFKPNFLVTNVNDSLVVNYIVNRKKCKIDDIQLGDVITKIDGISVTEGVNEKLSPLIPASNRSYLTYNSNYLTHSHKKELNVEMLRDGELLQRKIHLSEQYVTDNPYTKEGKHAAVEKLRNDVHYLDLSQLTKKASDSFFKLDKQKIQHLIIDARRYPNKDLSLSDLGDYLVNEKKNFFKVLSPINKAPSKFVYRESTTGFLGAFVNAFTVGKRSNKKYVRGKIILIVSRSTMSKGEYYGMAIQQAPNCITIGQQTAGSPMNITTFELPDGTDFRFTSMATFYPNSDLEVHQNGLKIDYYVPLSTHNYHSDQYIDFALKTIDGQ